MEVETEIVASEQNAKLTAQLDKVQSSKIPLEERLEKLPGLIFEKELAIYNLTCRLSEIKKSIELNESIMMREITAERTEDGKQKFSNDAARQAEMRIRLRDNENYKKLKEDEEKFHNSLEHRKIEHNFLRNMLGSAKWLAQLKSGEEGRRK